MPTRTAHITVEITQNDDDDTIGMVLAVVEPEHRDWALQEFFAAVAAAFLDDDSIESLKIDDRKVI